jgi:uncharacterized protein (TIGR02757 family)
LTAATIKSLYAHFEELYGFFNHYYCIYPDPLHFVYHYKTALDRELAGFISSSLAFGRVSQINRTLRDLFARIEQPTLYLKNREPGGMEKDLVDIKHRFVQGKDLVYLLLALKRTVHTYGCLGDCFKEGLDPRDSTLLPALVRFVKKIRHSMDGRSNFLLPDPGKGSALKRLNLFLRWMIRHDRVDPGVWKDLPKTKLIVPLDTHMYRMCLHVGFTRRKQPDLRTALEVTDCFRRINPEDPVKYDFALTRMGMGLS